jgi:dephospho-CoA kinase
MHDIIIVNGAPGSGKSTIAELLQREFDSPMIDFGWLREWHLAPDWHNTSPEEEQMAFENLVFILRNYVSHGYRNIIVHDLNPEHIDFLRQSFQDRSVVTVNLVVASDSVLRMRLLARTSGFRNVDLSLEWNRKLRDAAQPQPDVISVDNSLQDCHSTVHQILERIG